MVGVKDAVHYGVAEHHIGMCHIDFGSQYAAAVFKLAGAHTAEEVKVLLYRAVAPRAVLARRRHRAAVGAYFLKGLVVNVGKPLAYKQFGPLVELFEIVGGIVYTGPFETEPADVVLNRVYIFGVFLDRVGVVKTQVGLAAILLCKTEVEAY